MLQVYLVRHGETQWNAERRIQGQSDSPLTAKGEQQAMQVGERARTFGITHVISSDLGRTRRTAEIIAQACGCDITLDARLRELHMGVLEKRLRVMDTTAISLAMDNNMPIVVFNMFTAGNLSRVLSGEPVGTVVKGGQ